MLNSPWTRWGATLGFALGGFFDGILLHQILQWHHLLSLVPNAGDLRMQVLWDGYFHALMYVIALLGLWGIWRAHKTTEAGSGWHLVGALLLGFGLWHIVDAILSHWVLGIHRIKIESEIPLLWDLIWFAGFGIIPVISGFWILGRNPGGGAGTNRGVTAAIVLVGLATIGAGVWSLREPQDQRFTTVVFRPGINPAQIFSALSAVDAMLVWSDPSMGVVVLDVAPDRRLDLYGYGALMVSGSGVPDGCISWTKV